MSETEQTTREADQPGTASLRERWPRFWLKEVGKVLVGLLLLLVAGLLLLDTSPGRRLVAEAVRTIPFESGMRIEIGRIGGSLYGDMVLHDLSIHDPKGEFLFSPEVKLDWRPLAYLGNHVDIRSATAQRMTLQRLPELRETQSDAPLLPDLDIDVAKLEIERFIAAAPVSGVERVAAISGKAHIASGRAQISLDGKTLKGAATGGGDALSLVLDAVPAENRLAIKADLSAPRQGMIAALAGLRDPLAVKISGKGDWTAWNGKLTARSEQNTVADIRLTARDGTFALKGPATLAMFAPDALSGLLGSPVQIDLSAAVEKRRATVAGGLQSDTFSLSANGLADLGSNRFDDFRLAFVVLRPSALAPDLRASGLRALLTLDGAFATPRIAYSLNARRIVFSDIGVEALSAKGAATIDAEQILIPVNATAQRITGLDAVAGGKLSDVRLDGDLAISGARILSDNMRIRSPRIDATAIILANMDTGLYSGAIDGRIAGYRIESVGIFNVETDAELETAQSGEFALAGRVRARSTRLLNDTLRDYLGGNFVAASDVRYGADGTVRFTNLTLNAPDLRITGGKGSYSADGQLALSANGMSDRYGRIGVRVAGTIADPKATLTADRPGLGIGLADLEARLLGAGQGYRLGLKGDTDYGPLTADVTLGTRGTTTVRINRAELSGIAFTGTLRQTRAGPFAGTLSASGNGLGGIVELGAQGKFQQAKFKLRANGTRFSGQANLYLGSAIIDGRAVLYDNPHIVADAQLADTRFRGFAINAARIELDYRDGRGHAKALVENGGKAPFRLAANADLKPDLWAVALNGKSRGVSFRTATPARILPRSDNYELLPTKIDIGGGNVRLAGNYGKGLKIQSRLERVDLSTINAFIPGLGIGGKATGSLDFNQPTAATFPRADARLTLNGFTRTTASAVSQPVDISFAGKLLADGGEARAVFRKRGSVIGRMVASLRPLPPGAGPWTDRLARAALGGGIRYNGPAETLVSFAGLPGQEVSGSLGIAADFSCRLEAPCLTGVARGKNLRYLNEEYGTRLTNLNFSGTFGEDRLRVEQLSADAGKGTVTGSGYLSLSASAGYPMDIALELRQARIARSDLISASATGPLRLTKSAGEMALLSGTLTLPETRYKIVREGAAQVPQLAGVRFKPRKGRMRITGEEAADPFTSVFERVRLDIAVKAPEKLYVSGMGLDSEWRASFQVTGTSAAPQMAGSVNLVRGNLAFAGRAFELTRGSIGFTGGRTIDPTVRIVASEAIDDVDVNIEVGGRATNPQIGFSSTPSLPDDEILSRILFGSSIANLSAVQAVQLASSLNSLRGSGGGLNPLGKLRSATGIDRLRILGADEEAGRGTALAAGQYLTDDVYVELITDTRGFTATQLEVSITPWLSVLSQAGGSGSSNVNVRIRKSY